MMGRIKSGKILSVPRFSQNVALMVSLLIFKKCQNLGIYAFFFLFYFFLKIAILTPPMKIEKDG